VLLFELTSHKLFSRKLVCVVFLLFLQLFNLLHHDFLLLLVGQKVIIECQKLFFFLNGLFD
jgi:hypothetical protein